MPTVLQILKPSGKPSCFPTQQPIRVPTLSLMEFQVMNLLTFLEDVPSDHRSGNPPVAMSMNPIPLPSITPTTLPFDIPSEKPMMLVLQLLNSWMDI